MGLNTGGCVGAIVVVDDAVVVEVVVGGKVKVGNCVVLVESVEVTVGNVD